MIRTIRPVGVLLLALLSGACATKKDVRLLSADLNAMRMHQDSVLLSMQRQNRMLLDSIRAAMQISQDTRGATASRLREFDQTVDRLTQLMGQVTTGMTRIEQSMSALAQRLSALEERAQQQTQQQQGPSVEELWTSGQTKMSEESWASARLAFETLIQQYPNDPQAPAAQHQIAETYVEEEQWDAAYAAFDAVAARWSASPRAPAALLRAGIVAQEEARNRAKARSYYQRVISEYANSEERAAATRRLAQVR